MLPAGSDGRCKSPSKNSGKKSKDLQTKQRKRRQGTRSTDLTGSPESGFMERLVPGSWDSGSRARLGAERPEGLRQFWSGAGSPIQGVPFTDGAATRAGFLAV